MNKLWLKTQVFCLDYWAASAVHLSTEGSLWSTRSSLFLLVTTCSFSKDETALLWLDSYGKIANGNFTLLDFEVLSRDCSSILLMLFSCTFSCREKLEHDMLNPNFWKIAFHPKIKTEHCSRSNFQIWPTGRKIFLINLSGSFWVIISI